MRREETLMMSVIMLLLLVEIAAPKIRQTENREARENVGLQREATNWNGVCEELAKLAKPTLVITGTDDNVYEPHENSLVIAEKVPGTWLVQIKNAGHAVMDQYPDEIGKILQTFLSTTNTTATTTTTQPE
jgi:pimeloyl-ACP methyl ester carboxylesterase